MENIEDILLGKEQSVQPTPTPESGPDYEAKPTFGSYRGRARRSTFWGITLAVAIPIVVMDFLFIVPAMTASAIRGLERGDLEPILAECGYGLLAVLCISVIGFFLVLPVSVRRLHDRGMSGWWLLGFWLGGLIPIFGTIVGIAQFVIMGCLDSTPGPNRYGPDPKGRNPVGMTGAQPKAPVEERLRKLRDMKESGLVTEAEYDEKRRQVLADI